MRANTCLVVDVWEGQQEINEAVLMQSGVVGIGIRINDMNGGHHMDTNFYNQWDQAKSMVRFPYFVYNPWVDGATNFAWLAANCPTIVKTVAVDIEVRRSGYSSSTYAKELANFMTLAQARWKVILYTAQWFLPYLAYWPKVDYWWAQWPDNATFFSGVKTWTDLKTKLDNPKLAQPFNLSAIPGTLKLWQFSGDILQLPGTVRPIDINLFMGTAQDLAAYINSGPPNQPGLPLGLYVFAPSNYYSRNSGPLTLPLSRAPGYGDNLVREPWAILKAGLLKLNATNPGAVDQIASPNWGPSKGLDGDQIKWIGLAWPGRNILKVVEVVEGAPGTTGAWGRVEGVGVDQVASLTAYNNPEVVHMVYDYSASNGWAERAKPVYVPIIDGEWWVEMIKLVSVDKMLPKSVKIQAFPRLRMRATPDGNSDVVGYKYYGEVVSVEEVKIGAHGIFGRVAGGWIGLRYDGVNWTNWKL